MWISQKFVKWGFYELKWKVSKNIILNEKNLKKPNLAGKSSNSSSDWECGAITK